MGAKVTKGHLRNRKGREIKLLAELEVHQYANLVCPPGGMSHTPGLEQNIRWAGMGVG